MRLNPLHLNNLEVRRKTRVNPRNILTNRRVQKLLTPNQKGKLKFPCMICIEDHHTKYCPHHEEVTKFVKGTSQPTVLTDPFPPQQQQMVAQTPAPPQGGNTGHSHHGDASSSTAQVFMCKEMVSLMTRELRLMTLLHKIMPMEVLLIIPPLPLLLHLPPLFRLRGMLLNQCCHPPKGTIRKLIFNPSARAAQKYNIVEDLAQAPCAMSMLEVLQNCPSQHRTLVIIHWSCGSRGIKYDYV
jgi:hypothetical protein